jgi:hypothetical protein
MVWTDLSEAISPAVCNGRQMALNGTDPHPCSKSSVSNDGLVDMTSYNVHENNIAPFVISKRESESPQD